LMREAGWTLPRHRHAFGQPYKGIFSLREEHVAFLNRHSRVARLLQPGSMAPVDGINALVDAVLLRAGADEWIVTGIERVEQNTRVFDVAQTWVISPLVLE